MDDGEYFRLLIRREQCDEDQDDWKETTGEGVEENIRWKGILGEYDIVLVDENKCETFFMFI